MTPREYITERLDTIVNAAADTQHVVDHHLSRARRADWAALLETTQHRLSWVLNELIAMADDMEDLPQ